VGKLSAFLAGRSNGSGGRKRRFSDSGAGWPALGEDSHEASGSMFQTPIQIEFWSLSNGYSSALNL
jgi:hypothetical protein